MRDRWSSVARSVVLGVLALSVPINTVAQGTENGEWRSYGGDIANTRYAPLDQITADNFGDLEVAWRVKTANFGPNPEFNFQSTPLMIGGVVYSTVGSRRTVIAVTVKVISSVSQKYRFHIDIRLRVLATMIMKVADTVEKPVAIIAASRAEYWPDW